VRFHKVIEHDRHALEESPSERPERLGADTHRIC
jgi:hypothetical protein